MRELKDIIDELEIELRHIVEVPTMELSMRQQQVELSVSCVHVTQLTEEILEQQKFLLERLKHSETERFKR